jgi:hypothetical protein
MSLTKRHFFPEDYALFDAILEKVKKEEEDGTDTSEKDGETADP